MNPFRASRSLPQGFTLLEMTIVILVMLALVGIGVFSSRKMDEWRMGRAAAEVLRACAANIDDLRKSLAAFIKENTPTVGGSDEVDTQPTLGFQRVIQRAIMHGICAAALLALGYAGWSAGQLEGEIQANGWLHCPADADLIFDGALDAKYERALSRIGVDLASLSTEAGHG